MLHLYTWRTPNGRKVPILLAELGWRCQLHLIDLGKNEQKSPTYLAINPNGKIPALVDEDVVLFESGAILEYLADKAGRFLPREPRTRAEVLSWCWWQVGGPGPFFGQLGSFRREQPPDEHAVDKMFSESRRLAGVLDARLLGRTWVAGDYSIADMMLYPWFDAVANHGGDVLDGMDAVHAWMARMAARAPVQQGMALDVGS
jgi:GST-like protein